MRSLLRLALRNKRLVSYLRRVYSEAREDAASLHLPGTTIPEAEPLQCRQSDFTQARLNLLVPALAMKHVFGGISTALAFFECLGKDIPNLRIILTEQTTFEHSDNPQYADWRICSLGDADGYGRRIIPAGDRHGQTLPVGPSDRFIATAWWTAVAAQHIQCWQRQAYNFDVSAKYVYLIQDFEPGFYPWSSRFAFAESTYHNTEHVISVFNSGMLRSFFEAEGYSFAHAYTFEPTLNKQLRSQLSRGIGIKKERRVLVYGRPGVQRNAFEVVVMALRIWVNRNPDADWTFVSAGELHSPVELGHGKLLTSLGKLTIDEYATELGRSSVGVSLMISPHPSYPPLEMAAFGVRVVTNRYKSKDLSSLTPNITTIDAVSPNAVADAIDKCVQRFNDGSQAGPQPDSPAWRSFLESPEGFHLISEEVRLILFQPQEVMQMEVAS